jgi:membrane-associated phospholipid phosphatase
MICPKKIFYRSLKKNLRQKDTVLVFAFVIAIVIALSYAAGKFAILLLPLDLVSYFELREESSPIFYLLMLVVSALGEFAWSLLLTIIIVVVFALRRQWLEAIFMLATTSSVLLTFALKGIIQRPRPFPIDENPTDFVQRINQYSYPSGHVLFFVVFFGFLAYLAWIYLAGFSRIIVISLCVGLIILIGPSRVFLGAHWASDVAGSYVMGALWLSILILAHQWIVNFYCPDMYSETR